MVIDVSDEGSGDEAQQQGHSVEDERERSFNAGVSQVFLAVLTSVILVTEADLVLANSSSVASILSASACLVIFERLFVNLGSDQR